MRGPIRAVGAANSNFAFIETAMGGPQAVGPGETQRSYGVHRLLCCGSRGLCEGANHIRVE
jgi:hypothetical protein